MSKQKAGWLLLGIGTFLITSGLVLGTAVTEVLTNTGGAVGMRKVSAEVKPAWRGDKTLNLEMIKKFREEFGTNHITYTVESINMKQTKDWSGKKIDAAVTGADSNYAVFHGFAFSDGSFDLAEKLGAEKTAVISETLAWALFRTTRAAGMELELYGQAFRITGVFRYPEDILYTLVKPGLPDVLISAETMLSLDEGAYIASVELAVDGSITFGGNTERMNSALRRMGADTNRFIFTDFDTGRKSIAQKPALIVITAGFITVLLSIVYFIKSVMSLIREIWKTCRAYGMNPPWSAWLKQGLRLLLPAAVIAALLLLWRQSGFRLYVPAEYIPGETLDGQKYQELIREGFRRFFSGIREEASVNVKLFQAAGLLSGTIFRTAVYAGALLTFAGMTALSHTPLAGGVVKAGICQIAALLAACGLCLLYGLPVRIYTEGVLVLWTFVAACLTAYHTKDAETRASDDMRFFRRAVNTLSGRSIRIE